MNQYIVRPKVAVIFLEGGLVQAGGDADKFLAIYKAARLPLYNSAYQKVLKKFFMKNSEAILSLGLSRKQIRYMDRHIGGSIVSNKMLEDSFKINKANCAGDVETLFYRGLEL